MWIDRTDNNMIAAAVMIVAISEEWSDNSGPDG